MTHELAIDGLRAGVSGTEILRGVNLVVRSGEVHAVMGPNGSGAGSGPGRDRGRPHRIRRALRHPGAQR